MSLRPPAALPIRYLCLGLAALAMLVGLVAALARIGVITAGIPDVVTASHGLFMVYGFLGTAISLERAVALSSQGPRGYRIAYMAPLISGLGTVLLLGMARAFPGSSSQYRMGVGSGWALSQGLLCLIYLMIWQRQRSYATLISLLASTAGMAGAALWAAGVENAMIVPWWGMFLVLTIVAERVELARIEFSRAGVEKRLFGEALLVYLTLPVSLLTPEWGYPLLGVTLAAVITDVACHDSARHTIRVPGLARFSATCLLVGYGWVAIAALIWVVEGPVLAGYRYDAVIHSLTLGFVMSMIFAHAPVIVPAIARKQLPYHPVMWVTWGILQTGLLLRIVAGIRQVDGLWQFAGTLNVVAVLAFLVTTFVLIVAGAQHSPRSTSESEPSTTLGNI